MDARHTISWMPSWVDSGWLSHFDIAQPSGQPPRWSCARPSPESWVALGAGLSRASEQLREMPVADIVAAVDAVSRRWADPRFEPRLRARAEVVLSTGFSPEAVDRSFDVELRNYRADSLERTLRREFGDPRVLDGFQGEVELRGQTLAMGPRITLAILTGNVPGLPALSLVRALLVKSAVIAKVASGEPTFAALFVRSLFEVEPKLGDAVVVTYWDRADEASLRGALGQAEAVVAYGSDEACASVRAHLGPHQRYVEHGHKLSVGIVSKRYLEAHGPSEVARRIADDVSTFNQHACIAPQAYFVEGDVHGVRDFGGELAVAMEDFASRCPLGTLGAADAAALQLRRIADVWAAAAQRDCDVWHPRGLDWTITLAASLEGMNGAGNRALRVVPVESLRAAVSHVSRIARHLQNVGLGAVSEEFWSTALELGHLGACRISEPGRMAEPSMMWRHDGAPCVAALVRWCDIEMHRELATRDAL